MDVPAENSRPVGSIFVEKGLITEEQLETALRLQQETGERLGEIVVGEFGVPRLELASVLAEQWADYERAHMLPEPEGARAPSPPTSSVAVSLPPGEPLLRRPIGEIFVERGFVDEEQLRAAVDLQRRTGQRLGEVLVEQGALSRLDLASALAEQWANVQKAVSPGAVSLPVSPDPDGASLEQNGVAIADLASRLVQLEQAVASVAGPSELAAMASALREELGELEERLSQVSRVEEAAASSGIAAATAAVEQRLEALEGLEDRVAGRSQLSELGDRLDAVAGQVEAAQTGLAGLASRLDGVDELSARIDGVAASLPGLDVVEELRHSLAEVAERAAAGADQPDQIAALGARLDQVSASLGDLASRLEADSVDPATFERGLTALQHRIDELAHRPVTVDLEPLERRLATLDEQARAAAELQLRVDELSRRLDDVPLHEAAPAADSSDALQELRERVTELAARDDAARFAELERGLDALRSNVHEHLERLREAEQGAPDAQALGARIDEIELRLANTAGVEAVRAELASAARASAAERESLEQSLTNRIHELAGTPPPVAHEVDELRKRIDELATRPAVDDEARSWFDDVSARVDDVASRPAVDEEARSALSDLRRRLDDLSAAEPDVEAPGPEVVGEALERIDALEERVRLHEESVGADQSHARIDALEERVRLHEESVGADQSDARIDALEERVRLHEESVGADQSHARIDALEERVRLHEQSLQADQSHTRIDAVEDRLSRTVGHDELDGLREELRARHETLQQSVDAVREDGGRAAADAARQVGLVEALANQLDARARELAGRADANDAALGELRQQVAEVAGADADHDEWRGRVEAGLSGRVDGVEQQLEGAARAARAEAEAAREELGAVVDSLSSRVDELGRQRVADAEGARIADDELAARIDDLGRRWGVEAATAHADVRAELERLASALGALEAERGAARDEARAEIEQATASLGWRLEQLEGAHSAADPSSTHEAIERLERRLDAEAAQAEEQVRVTEKALRKGLASLGAQLAETQATYTESGNALRRSIERLGAAVADADAQMTGVEVESGPAATEFVAFAPTEEGYRLVVVDGAAPEVGDEIELPEHPGPLVVTRVGRSPLPLDARPCAYLDRVSG